jgi:prevent-host-death family protein
MTQIPQRVLRNDVSSVLRRVTAGEEFIVTVRGEPVAELRPLPAGPRRYVPLAAAARELRALPPDASLRTEIREGRDHLGYLDQL